MMRERVVVSGLMLLSVLACAGGAAAQTTWSDRARISINGGLQQPSTTFTSTAHPIVYDQTATVTTSYNIPTGAFFDGDVILRTSGGFGVDIGVSSFRKSQSAPVAGSIPSPVASNTLRPFSGTSGTLDRNEIIGRIDAAYVVSAGIVDLAVSAGPSFFTVNQDLVGNVTFAESPTNDRVAFSGAAVTTASATKIGFNAGLDVGIKLSKYVGVGGIVRYSHASLSMPLANTAPDVTVDAGGLHVGGGVRLYF